MDIIACGSRPSRRGPAPSFTGTVWQDPIIQAPDPALLRSAWVRFEPGARTAWHTHPLGQTLHITSGIGHVQTWGGPIRQVRAGDTVWIPPGEKHWHGATPEHGMEHIAMQEAQGRRARDMARAGDRRAIQGQARGLIRRRRDQARVNAGIAAHAGVLYCHGGATGLRRCREESQ